MHTPFRTMRLPLGRLKVLAVALGIAGSLVTGAAPSVAAAGGVAIVKPALAQTKSSVCYVDGRFYLTPAEGLRRVGSWTDSASASDVCPSDPVFRVTPDEGLRRVGSWTRP
jgi:hypothetical protein